MKTFNELVIIYQNSSKEWYLNGQRHRDNDLPAVEYVNGTKKMVS